MGDYHSEIAPPSSRLMNKIIEQAIRQKRTVTFTYDGKNRIVQVYAYGISQAGNEVIRGYETGGSNPGWGLMLVEKMEGLKMSAGTFGRKKAGYKKGDRGMKEIFVEV